MRSADVSQGQTGDVEGRLVVWAEAVAALSAGQDTYIVLVPVKLQGLPQLSQLSLEIRHLLLLLCQPGGQNTTTHTLPTLPLPITTLLGGPMPRDTYCILKGIQ